MQASWPQLFAGGVNALPVADTQLQSLPLTDSSWSERERERNK